MKKNKMNLFEVILDTFLFIALLLLIVWVIVINMNETKTYAADAPLVIELKDDIVVCNDDDYVYYPKREEITALALVVVGEASNCDLRTQIAVMWTVLNRVDAGFGDTIEEVCSAKSQFVGYERAISRLDDDSFVNRVNLIKPYCYDIIFAWMNDLDQYRNLPDNYTYFRSDKNHTTNYFLSEQNWKCIYSVDKAKSKRYRFDMPCIWEEDENYLKQNWLFEVNKYEG